MMTPTHLLIAGAALSRRGEKTNNLAIITGALVPDVSIYVLYGWARLVANIPSRTVWSQIYWQEPWQTLSAISNSIPLYLTLLFAGMAARLSWLTLFAAAALLHVAFDLPFHSGDAHQHFWPLSDLRYHSPLSYWDTAHHAQYVAIGEMALALGCMAVIWHRFNSWWVKGAMGLGIVSYIAVPLYFRLTLG